MYVKEITELQDALWNQMGLKVEYKRQQSLMDNAQSDESKNTNQTSMMPVGSGQ